MPTPPLSDDLAREALRVWYEHGQNTTQAAEALGLPWSSLRHRLQIARERGFHLSEGANAIVSRARLSPTEAAGGWLHTYSEDGKKLAATYWRAPDLAAEDAAQILRDALTDIPPAPTVTLESHPDADLVTLIPIADAHIGLMAWGRESGEDWDTRKGAERLTRWVGRALCSLAASSRCILLFAGDLLHADDNRAETPASKHRLDTDTRHFKTLETVIEAAAHITEMALRHHETVTLRFLPGNHDPHASTTVMLAMAERYRLDERVTVQKEPSEFFVYQFGKVLIAAHHGHRAKASQMVHFIADEYAPLWGKTRWRYLFTGHLHHHKSQDIGGMSWEQLPSISARDAYTVSNAYVSRARLAAITYHRERGEVARTVIGEAPSRSELAQETT